MSTRLGVDFGGSGIKGALVDLDSGALVTERYRIPTPDPSTPASVAGVIAEIAAQAGWAGDRFGCAVPAVVTHGMVRTAANIDQSWIGTDAERLISEVVGGPMVLLNDADAAGLAELRFGAARGSTGTVLMLTFGTGIGSALFSHGVLFPNTELGHLELDGHDAEHRASAKAHEDESLSFEHWTRRVNRYIAALEALLWPDLIVFGGGISKQFADFGSLLESRAPIVPAAFRNSAGIIGAALAAEEGK